ncbi:RNA polymerase sigma-70 factor (ECF subfamily) [Paenibacillus eucommiae]|uniref:RNA polymerase sigma-70 factor (ECF subfamily) n=1 Tax=Paenibacillus eucommiae TaxID=1355755 RepID=A0ABS4J3R4_9BACL|nr:RNA polymerase sigma-70 factor (ECF subfamily) [Paenibacillus eucommiae]
MIRHTYDDIYRFVRWKVHDADLAWDLSQMAYEKAWAKLHTFNSEQGSFLVWLMTIAHHICIDHFRSKAVRQAGLNENLTDHVPAEGDFLDGVLMREEIKQVYTAIQSLPEDQRDALLLRYKSELTFTEIAAVTAESESTVKSRVRRSLIKLRDMLRGSSGEQRSHPSLQSQSSHPSSPSHQSHPSHPSHPQRKGEFR